MECQCVVAVAIFLQSILVNINGPRIFMTTMTEIT